MLIGEGTSFKKKSIQRLLMASFVQQRIKDIVDEVRPSLEIIQKEEGKWMLMKDRRVPETNLIDFTLCWSLAQSSKKVIQ